MKSSFTETFFVGLVAGIINVIWETALGAWILMVAMGNAHHVDARIPNFGYWGCVSVALPLMAFIQFTYNTAKDSSNG